eukprot:365752-Chlamydomonas_euryale.AAC.6
MRACTSRAKNRHPGNGGLSPPQPARMHAAAVALSSGTHPCRPATTLPSASYDLSYSLRGPL